MLFTREPSVSPPEAANAVARDELVLIDVRRPPELQRGRVRKARNIPLGELRERLHELDRDRQIGFLCHSGARSSRATRIAIKAGYNAVNVRGGLTAWNRAGLPVTR